MSLDVFPTLRKASFPLLMWNWVGWVPSCFLEGRVEPKGSRWSLATDPTSVPKRPQIIVLRGWEAKLPLLSRNQFASLKMRGLEQWFPKLEHPSND